MDVVAQPSSGSAWKGMELTGGAHMSSREGRENATSLVGANQKGKHISVGAPSAHEPNVLVREAVAYEEGWSGVGGVGPVGLDPREDSI
jgi:hypothetical protein